jgi:hypothetical protein
MGTTDGGRVISADGRGNLKSIKGNVEIITRKEK